MKFWTKRPTDRTNEKMPFIFPYTNAVIVVLALLIRRECQFRYSERVSTEHIILNCISNIVCACCWREFEMVSRIALCIACSATMLTVHSTERIDICGRARRQMPVNNIDSVRLMSAHFTRQWNGRNKMPRSTCSQFSERYLNYPSRLKKDFKIDIQNVINLLVFLLLSCAFGWFRWSLCWKININSRHSISTFKSELCTLCVR